MKFLPPYEIIHEDAQILAVNKSSGISVGQDRWDISKDRLDKLIEKDLKIPKIFTVHRIDKETSGIILFSKDRETHKMLSTAFERREVNKKYIAVVHGRPSWKESSCNLSLVPNGNKKHMTIIDKYKGKKSLTRFIYVLSAGNFSILEAFPETGRIHQIRVHAAAMGHPVVCDNLYGKENPVKLSSFKRSYSGDPYEEKPLLSRLGLHAYEVILPSGKTFTAPLAKDMSSLKKQMEKHAK